MQFLTVLTPQGRLRPQPFLISIAAVYLVGAASYLLTVSDVTARIGLWPFAAVQALLTWIWFTLHAKRLHDAARGHGLAIAVALLYLLLSVLVLLLLAPLVDGMPSSAPGLILLLYIIMTLAGSLRYDLTSIVVVVLTLSSFAPILIALGFTLWTATRTSAAQP